MDEIIKKLYEGSRWLTFAEQVKMLEAPNAVELAKRFFERNGDWLCNEAQLKMFDLPKEQCRVIFKLHIERHFLCLEAFKKMLALNYWEFYLLYSDKYGCSAGG